MRGGPRVVLGLTAALLTGTPARAGPALSVPGSTQPTQVRPAPTARLPVVFDNFIWWTDAELVGAIAGAVPGFDGTAPETDAVVNAITTVLERLLQEQHVAGHVEYLPPMPLDGPNRTHRFRIRGVPLPVCALHFPLARGIREAELRKVAATLVHVEYWQRSVTSMVADRLLPLYRRRGFLRVQAPDPVRTRFVSTKGCPSGVDLSIAIEEGIDYRWGGVSWTGNAVFVTKRLDAGFALKVGGVADGPKIDAGVADARALYGRAGYVDAKLTVDPHFDDAQHRAEYRVVVSEGPQYRMGAVTVVGLSDADARRLLQAWRLKRGQIYDLSYVAEFLRSDAAIHVRNANRTRTLSVAESRNSTGPSVDVVITVK